jgi:lipopolysaccharide/colanic/teichoic acid biosynthesis glycosyltransferase
MKKSSFHQKHSADHAVGGAAHLDLVAVVGGMHETFGFQPTAAPRALQNELQDEPLANRLPGRSYQIYRRALDIVASLVGLTLLLAVLPILAVLIKLDSRGPVFYRQSRVGINRRHRANGHACDRDRRKILQPGRPLEIIKLRTMTVNAEANGPQWASRNDSRVTRVGQVLRKTRLDELPQFWNVLRGGMSLIGPRPERPVFVRQFGSEVPNYYDRLLVKPGLTGLAQVRNGYDTDTSSVHRKVAYDREAIRRAGLAMDLRILLATVSVVIKGEGAH